MEMKIPAIAITAVVVVIVLAGVLMPVLDDSTATEDTYVNDGFFRMSQYDNTTNHVVSWTYEKPGIITTDGVDVPINYSVKNGQITVIANSIWLVRMYTDANGLPSGIAFLYGSSGTKIANVADEQTASFTLTSGVASVVCGTYTGTHNYDIVYVPTADGDFTMKNGDVDAYINSDSTIYGFGLTRVKTSTGTVGSPGVGFAFSGTYTDGLTGSVWRGATETTVSDVVCVATEDKSHIDLYRFKEIDAVATFSETIDDSTVTTDTDLVYNMVIVPYEVTAERTVHFTDNESAIFAAIPIMVIVALLIAVVALVFRGRDF